MDIYRDPYYITAVSIVNKLLDNGFIAYFAGGWVRDFLLGHPSQDIDIATNAPPERIVELFDRTIQVGIAFGVVIVVESGHHFEVATFRKDVEYTNGRTPKKIELAEDKEDALRRDFTINGMFFDPISNSILDFVGGKDDLAKKIIRCIGKPQERFAEDRLRMIRAIRFASRFSYHIDPATEEAIKEYAPTIFPAVSMERIWQELSKMKADGHFDKALIDMHRLGLLKVIFHDLTETPMEAIQHWVSVFPLMPANSPTILYILKLFPRHSLKQWESIGLYLKINNRDMAYIDVYWKTVQLLNLPPENVELADFARLYANPLSEVCIKCYLAEKGLHQMEEQLSKHKHRMHLLSEDIKRISLKQPLVNASELQLKGISPGKQMGNLLKEAERIAINERLHHPEDVIRLLKKLPLWSQQ